MTLHGKNALVTGGGSGIGQAIARELTTRGCRVAVAGRREGPLRETAESIPLEVNTTVSRMRWHVADVAERSSVQTLMSWFAQEIGPLDILVNAAGINVPQRSVSKLAPEDWDRILAVNATGAFNCIHAALPQMRARQDGIIINISSTAGKRATPLGGVAYNASKSAMTALGTSVAAEEACHGIRVTNIFPGEVDTPILEQRPQPVSDAHRAQILQATDVAVLVAAIVLLPSRAHVAEVVIKPTSQPYA